ncbi:MAG TPA: sn-glycerol-3-phosphate ABC transporter ATP-binding protein UgpC [Chthoniobacterales bacterium]|jgi:multiple sugar transport system ATP-binding protein|nr:sn-glycerol-3-phosphate ABC transporter ATP-binding protein UgpC [Chthoniobacterales bacterium]
MAKVSVNNVSKIYPGEKGSEVTAVNGVSLEIADREFVVLVGPSGCGKSTILRMIAGLEEISTGDLYIGEKRVNDVAPKDRDIAMVFQNYALYPHMSVYDNLAFGLKLRKFPKTEIRKRVVDAAGILGIESLLKRKPKALSGGQRLRVAVGRAIVRQPKVFLFDEPLSNLDAKMRVQMRSELTKLHQRLQATMIYVTHDQIEAMTMGDRIVVMHDGVVQQNDAPLVLYKEPVNLFVAGFLGSPPTNFISGTLKQDGDKIRFTEIEGGTIDVRFPAADRPAAREFVGKNVIFGIRPEDLEVATFTRKEGKAAGTGFPAIVDIVEPMGAETNLYLQTGAHTLVCRSQGAFDHREAGRRLQFEMNLAKAHLFDPGSTNRIR